MKKFICLFLFCIITSCVKDDIFTDIVKRFNGSILDQSTSLEINREFAELDKVVCLTLEAKYTGEKPEIQLYINDINGNSELLFVVGVGGVMDYVTNSIFLPPLFDKFTSFTCLFNISEGATLSIKSLSFKEIPYISGEQAIRMHAHLGYSALETANSIKAFEMAGMSGFYGCICNPISDRDGGIWCYHAGHTTVFREGQLIAINPYELSTEEMSSLTLYSSFYPNQHIPTFQEYCRVCSKYGMKATLSIGYLPQKYYADIKDTLLEYGLIEGLTLKDGRISTLEQLYSLFGDDVSYLLYGMDCSFEQIDAMVNARLGSSRRVIEPYVSSLNDLSSEEEIYEWCNYAMNNGLGLSLIQSGPAFEFSRFIKYGFKEFTSDSLNLMWE